MIDISLHLNVYKHEIRAITVNSTGSTHWVKIRTNSDAVELTFYTDTVEQAKEVARVFSILTGCAVTE